MIQTRPQPASLEHGLRLAFIHLGAGPLPQSVAAFAAYEFSPMFLPVMCVIGSVLLGILQSC